MNDEPKKPVLTHGDLLVMQAGAGKEFRELPNEYRLEGMKRPFDHSERLAISWLRASLSLLNRKGALRSGFLDEFEQPLVLPDSDPASCEDPDWEQVDDGKQKGKKP